MFWGNVVSKLEQQKEGKRCVLSFFPREKKKTSHPFCLRPREEGPEEGGLEDNCALGLRS